jgi:hypothetical protein
MRDRGDAGRERGPVGDAASAGAPRQPAPLPAATPPPASRRFCAHSSYMADELAVIANVHLLAGGGRVLLAHAERLVLGCRALAAAPRLFAGGSAAAPTVLSAPFDAHSEEDVARFLRALYGDGARAAGADALRVEDPAWHHAVRLAHVLDARGVVGAARRRLHERPVAKGVRGLVAAATLAAGLGWDELFVGVAAAIVAELGLPRAKPDARLALLVTTEAFHLADVVAAGCPREVLSIVLGTLAADSRSLDRSRDTAEFVDDARWRRLEARDPDEPLPVDIAARGGVDGRCLQGAMALVEVTAEGATRRAARVAHTKTGTWLLSVDASAIASTAVTRNAVAGGDHVVVVLEAPREAGPDIQVTAFLGLLRPSGEWDTDGRDVAGAEVTARLQRGRRLEARVATHVRGVARRGVWFLGEFAVPFDRVAALAEFRSCELVEG